MERAINLLIPEKLPEPAKFQYLTLLNGISYQTHCRAGCDQAIQLLSKSIEKI
nr:hypothetical protein [Cylindrospermum stagnale]